MGNYFSLQQSNRVLKNILNENLPPVARFRLFSQGVTKVHCLEDADHVAGNRSCLACGNCVDTCPQVRRLRGQLTLSNNRTSMYLENIVAESCIRCYSCIGSCPQVDRQLKNYAVRFRISEKMVHWFLAAMYIIAAVSGIGLNHFLTNWDQSFVFLVGVIHRVSAVGVLLAPILLYLYDRDQLLRILRRTFSWSGADWRWLKDALRYVRGDERVCLYQGDFNPGQKVWYLLLTGSFFVLGISGIAKWLGPPYFSAAALEVFSAVHIAYAMSVDICLGIHIIRKILRLVIRLRELFSNKLFLHLEK